MSESFEKAVEEAARAIDPMAWDTHYRFAGWEERTGNVMPSDAMNHLTSGSRSLARAALEAALPHLTAQDVPHLIRQAKAEAWGEGYRVSETAWVHAYSGHPDLEGGMCSECSQPNPYAEETTDDHA